jgi:hypothetical protein
MKIFVFKNIYIYLRLTQAQNSESLYGSSAYRDTDIASNPMKIITYIYSIYIIIY